MVMTATRRRLLQAAGLGGGMALLEFSGLGRLAMAAAPGENRLLTVILRGGMDGLAAVVPYGDAAYADARGGLAMPQEADALIALDSFFAVPPALKLMADWYRQKQLVVMHAMATPYRERSHFDAQNCLENGSGRAHGLDTGWMNRALAGLQGRPQAIAIGPNIPLLLRGPASINAWAPSVLPEVDDEFMARVMAMYEPDVQLHKALVQAEGMVGSDMSSNVRGNRAFAGLMAKAAEFMVADNGARMATVELSGWDTHANQGLAEGRLALSFGQLVEGLQAYQKGMGTAWNRTAVLVVTEFGRTVKVNGSRGSDHGTGSAAFLLGGAVRGGQIAGDWPGLASLHENRDLKPANDMRALFKTVLNQHMRVESGLLEEKIFPDSRSVAPMTGLIQRS